MSPPGTNSCTSWHGYDGVILVLNAGVAGEVPVVDVLEGVVARRCPNTFQLALVGSIDRDLLEDGVSGH
jgi:hypothetical protein